MGFREWWDRVMGSGGKEATEEKGLSEPSEQSYNDYQEKKADDYVEQRDPGVSHLGSGDE